jgi:hypothetical protein
LWPRRRADSIHNLVRLGIHEHLEEFLARLRVVRERSVAEAEASRIIEAADAVEDTAAVQGPEPEVADENRHDGSNRDRRRGNNSTQPMSNCFHANSAARAREKSVSPRPIATIASSKPWRAVSALAIPTGPYESSKSCESRGKRSIVSRDGHRARNMNPSGGDWTAEQGFTDQFVDGDHKPSNGRHSKGQRRRRQDLLGQRDECGGRALV